MIQILRQLQMEKVQIDPLSGKLFQTGVIKPKAFVEYGASNLQDGRYPFYLVSKPSVKGELTIISSPAKK